jgi:hypothetical protein
MIGEGMIVDGVEESEGMRREEWRLDVMGEDRIKWSRLNWRRGQT